MKISILQTNVCRGETSANLKHLRNLLKNTPDIGEIVLLPELFTSGYLFDDPETIQNLAEPLEYSQTVNELQELAVENGCLMVAGMPERYQQQYFNSAVVVDEEGLQHSYRKIALSSVDRRYFNGGNQLTVFEYAGIRFGMAICFDLWFPEIIRQYSDQNIDVLLHLANFGGEQSLHIARARAIENSMFVVTCNRVGAEKTQDIDGTYCGCSRVISPTGQLIACAGGDEEVIFAELDVESGVSKKVIGVDLKEEIKAICKAMK